MNQNGRTHAPRGGARSGPRSRAPLFAALDLGTNNCRLLMAAPDGAGGWANALVSDTDLVISSFGEDQNGELYVVDYGGGTIYRMMPAQ